jgi:hypothetical protein
MSNNPKVRFRQMVERLIATAVVDEALKAGYVIGIDNGGDDVEFISGDREKILKEMMQTDDERLYVYPKPTGGKRVNPDHPIGYVYFVYGNDGWDVINDYTTNLEKMLEPVSLISDRIQNGDFSVMFTPPEGEQYVLVKVKKECSEEAMSDGDLTAWFHDLFAGADYGKVEVLQVFNAASD